MRTIFTCACRSPLQCAGSQTAAGQSEVEVHDECGASALLLGRNCGRFSVIAQREFAAGADCIPGRSWAPIMLTRLVNAMTVGSNQGS